MEIKAEDSEVQIDRRQELRVSVKVGVTCSSDSNFFIGFTENISEGGLFLATYDLLPVGEQIELELQLPNHEEPIRTHAEVRWHRRLTDPQNGELVGFGAKFMDLPVSDHAHLKDFIETREPLFHPE